MRYIGFISGFDLDSDNSNICLFVGLFPMLVSLQLWRILENMFENDEEESINCDSLQNQKYLIKTSGIQ